VPLDTTPYLVKPGSRINLGDIPSRDDGGLDKDEGKQRFDDLTGRLEDLQELMYAEGKHKLLVVLQAMDAAGKDSTVRHVFGPLNPAGVRVTSFKAPSKEELAHDYLWRIHQHAPATGQIAVFNRSHYEDVLIVRVKGFAPEHVWRKRYEHINAFEQMLADEGTTILKFYLHISKDYQKQRLQRRLDRPDKHWKFNPDDLKERARWETYGEAFNDALSRCSTEAAPWYVIPSERRWFRNLLIAQIVADRLEALNMKYPEPTFDPTSFVIK